MENRLDQEGYYPIPFEVRSHLRLSMQLLYLLIFIIFTSVLFLPGNGDVQLVLIKAGSIFMDLLFLTQWLYTGFLKKAFIYLDKQGITFMNFKKTRVEWRDVQTVNIYNVNHNSFIGLIPKNVRRSRNFIARIFQSEYALSIPLSLFSTIDTEKLCATLTYLISNVPKKEDPQRSIACQPNRTGEGQEMINEGKEKVYSNQTALLQAFGVSVLLCILNILLTLVFQGYFAVITVFGAMAVVWVYYKNCENGRIPFLNRILLGIFSSVPVFFAPLTSLIWLNKNYVELVGFWETVSQCATAILHNPKTYAFYYFTAAFLFLLAVFNELNLKFIRRIKKLFIKKQNGFSIEKSGRLLSVYLLDYVNFDSERLKKIVDLPANICLIERVQKEIGAFYIPVDIFESPFIHTNLLRRVKIGETNYFKLDLGGHGNPVPYGFPSTLMVNENNEIEVIQLELVK